MLWIWMNACGFGTKISEDSGTVSNQHPINNVPISGCGLEEYSFLPVDTMGEILAIDYRPELSMSAEAIHVLSASFSLPLPPPQYAVETYFVQYRSQDKGKEAHATAIIALPVRSDPDVPILLWEHPTMGFADECAPSARGVIGAAYPILFASLGMAVAAPDYFGMSGWRGSSDTLHPYFVAEPTAIASLDAVRALRNTLEREEIELDVNTQKMVIWGASEGGYAALMSDRYAPYYAPEFTSVATVATIPGTDPLALAQHGVHVFGPTTAGILGAQVTHAQWYEADVALSDIMVPAFAMEVEAVLFAECSEFDMFDGLSSPSEIFTQNYIDGVLEGEFEPWTCFLTENSIVHTPVPFVRAAPTFIITAENDDLAIAEPVHADIQTLCTLGQEIEHLQCAGLGHVQGAVDTIGIQWHWIASRLDGEALSGACVVHEPVQCVSSE